MDWLLYIKHKLTLYHWRDVRKAVAPIAMCKCGWKARFLRTPYKYHLKRPYCKIVGHDWDEPYTWSSGPIGYKEEDADMGGTSHICNRCLKAEDL